MNTPIEQKSQTDAVWDGLSQDAKHVALFSAKGGLMRQEKGYFENLANDPQYRCNVEKALEELEGMGVLEKISYIDELREKLSQLPDIDPMLLRPLHEVPTEELESALRRDLSLTEAEKQYLALYDVIARYETNPQKHKDWEKVGYRLTHDFYTLVTKQRDFENA